MMDLIVSWLCSAIAKLLETISDFFTGLFGYDISTFNDTFHFAAKAYDIIRNVSLALALILAAWQVIVFFTRGADKAPATPIRAALNAVIAVAFIFYGNYLFEAILKFCQYPFDALNDMSSVEGGLYGGSGTSFIVPLVKDRFAEYYIVFYLIMLILIGFSYIKLLLEIVERYVVTFVLMYLSPLASATLASSSTSGIYKKFFTMFISQCLLLFLNVWCLKMAVSGLDLSSSGHDSPTVSFLLCYAFLRVSAKMDSYINQLGLNAAITGTGLGAEIFATGQSLFGGHGGGGGNGGGGGLGNKILGAGKTVGTWMNRYRPVAAATKAVTDVPVNAAKGASEAFRSGAVANAKGLGKVGAVFGGAGEKVAEGFKNSDNLISNAVGKHNSEEKVSGINSKTGRVGMVATGNSTHVGYRNELNNELISGGLDKNGEFSVEKENANISAWSNNQHLAADGFSYVQKNNLSVNDPNRVAAIAEGLGVGKHSKEVAEFVNAGYGRDGAQNINYTLDASGIHGQHDANGYRHKTDIVNRSQYDKLTTQERSGFEKMERTKDGKQYFVRSTKTQLEKPVADTNSGKTKSNTAASPEQTQPIEQSAE